MSFEKSKYGKEIIYPFTGKFTSEQVSYDLIPSSLKISENKEKEIKDAFEERKKSNPNFFDGALWRYEGHEFSPGGVIIRLSPTSYMQHNILRFGNFKVNYGYIGTSSKEGLFEKGKLVSNYPNPFSINAVQRTLDGYLLIGVKGEKSDQVGLGVMGAGFIKRKEQNGQNLIPETIFTATHRECIEETSYMTNSPTEGDIRDFFVLGTIFGSNHDTTTCIYVPLKVQKSEIGIGNKEHSSLIFLKDDPKLLYNFLEIGGISTDYINYGNTIFETYDPRKKKDLMSILKNSEKGLIPFVDHLIGDIELYLRNRKTLLE